MCTQPCPSKYIKNTNHCYTDPAVEVHYTLRSVTAVNQTSESLPDLVRLIYWKLLFAELNETYSNQDSYSSRYQEMFKYIIWKVSGNV